MAQGAQPRIPDPDEQFERSRQQATEQTSQSVATQTGGDPSEIFEEPDHWDKLSSFDIGRDEVPDEIEELLATELSDKYTLGNFDRDDWFRFGLWAENEIHTALKEFPDADSSVSGTDYYIMYGKREGLSSDDGMRNLKAPLTDEMYRRLWSAADAKKAGMTGSVGKAYLKALTEITAVSRTETESNEKKSRMEQIRDFLA